MRILSRHRSTGTLSGVTNCYCPMCKNTSEFLPSQNCWIQPAVVDQMSNFWARSSAGASNHTNAPIDDNTLIIFTPPLHHRVCSCLRAQLRLCAFVQTNNAVFLFVTNPHLLVHLILPSHLCVIQTAPATTPSMVRASFVTYPFNIIISRKIQGESAQTVPATHGGIKWT
jgi:hypothetical protein